MSVVIHVSGNVLGKISFLWTPCWVGFALGMSRFESFVLILDRREKGVKKWGIQERLKTLLFLGSGQGHDT